MISVIHADDARSVSSDSHSTSPFIEPTLSQPFKVGVGKFFDFGTLCFRSVIAAIDKAIDKRWTTDRSAKVLNSWIPVV